MRKTYLVLAAALVLAVAVTVWAFFWIRAGLSARDEPSAVEAAIAGAVRRLAIPRSARAARNPIGPTPDALADGLAHFADHCAICHGNDGSGQTPVGRNLYPRAPDMRLPPTQRLTDGELYSIIRNGVRLTGMPAWGDAALGDRDEDSWKLVHFIRRLPTITREELREMERLNPKSAAELAEEREAEEFLSGAEAVPAPVAPEPRKNTSPRH